MGSEKDSESPHTSVTTTPTPKCRASGKRPGRISFHRLFHGKRGSRRTKSGASPSLVQQLQHHHHQLQQLLPPIPYMPSARAPSSAPKPSPAPVPVHAPAPATATTTTTIATVTSTVTTAAADAAADAVAASPREPPSSTHNPPEALSASQASLGLDPGESELLLECPLCLVRQPAEQLPALHGCGHRSCLGCLRQYLRIEITESRVQLSCPECAERLVPRQVADILQDAALLDKYEEFLLRRCLVSDPDCRWCPAPDCGFAVIASGCASCPRLVCRREGCGAEFCYHCKQAWHPNQTSDDIKPPSGCTFWGKKPWSRKKKILWQLGTLIGAPIGITLIAGIAVPAMVIGIPVYVGRKIHAHYELRKASRHRRNLAITGGVALSIITAPVVAAVSVGIGVPIMLAYVYGVVPISLCRGGGCGVSREKGRGVRIDFDEDDGPITVADAWRALKSPSLGESSLEGAASGLSTTTPSEGLSVAPGTLGDVPHFNTLAGGALGTRTGKYSRLEVQGGTLAMEGAQRETGSLGAGSDCASTRGVAGSIISSYTLPDRECTNLEIQVDIETKPSHLCLTSEEDLTPLPGMATCSGGEEPQDCSSRRGGALSDSALRLSPSGASLREGSQDLSLGEGPQDVTLGEGPRDVSLGEGPQDVSLGEGPRDISLGEEPRDVTLAQPESFRSDLELSDTQSDDIAELTSDDCDSPHPKSCRPASSASQIQAPCRALDPSTQSFYCPTEGNVILYVLRDAPPPPPQ
ncbi:hypothetical protein NHX12_023619 [Muraenolepis orangiensis]|uniref:RBR-type E3 ubiquitin transferase n=1 Tax=Muraenolepis orangiensis TaxID=630683 RepID=A0A9Q0ERA4_9TELE|nr:hypothetical protein NHX12_023619 [Muraenolepis orangiensis]